MTMYLVGIDEHGRGIYKDLVFGPKTKRKTKSEKDDQRRLLENCGEIGRKVINSVAEGRTRNHCPRTHSPIPLSDKDIPAAQGWDKYRRPA